MGNSNNRQSTKIYSQPVSEKQPGFSKIYRNPLIVGKDFSRTPDPSLKTL